MDVNQLKEGNNKSQNDQFEEQNIEIIKTPALVKRSDVISSSKYYRLRDMWNRKIRKDCETLDLDTVLQNVNTFYDKYKSQGKLDFAFAYKIDTLTSIRTFIWQNPDPEQKNFKSMKNEMVSLEFDVSQAEFQSKNFIEAVLYQHEFWNSGVVEDQKNSAEQYIRKAIKCIQTCEQCEWTAWVWNGKGIYLFNMLTTISPNRLNKGFDDVVKTYEKCRNDLQMVTSQGGCYVNFESTTALFWFVKAKLKLPFAPDPKMILRCLNECTVSLEDIVEIRSAIKQVQKEVKDEGASGFGLLAMYDKLSNYTIGLTTLREAQIYSKDVCKSNSLAVKALQQIREVVEEFPALASSPFHHTFSEYIENFTEKLELRISSIQLAESTRKKENDGNRKHDSSPASSDFEGCASHGFSDDGIDSDVLDS